MSKVVVIGAGFGGLAAAIRLQAQGFQVTLMDKRDRLGGRAYVYQQDGFTFDAGPTVVTAPHCLEELFSLAGRRMQDYVEMIPITPLYRLHWENGATFDYTSDLEETLSQIERKSPGDVEGYRRFLEYSRQVFEAGYTKLAHEPFLNWGSMVKVSPQLLRLQAYRSVYSMVSKYIRDDQLRQAFSFHSLLVGGNPFNASAIYTLIHFLERRWGVFFPRGGTGALVSALGRLFEELGGVIRTGAEISKIAVRGGRVCGVETRGGGVESADCVVSNADVHETYTKLLKDEQAVRSTRWFLERSRYAMSLFVLYFGTNRKFSQPAHHNVLFGSRYKELIDDIFHRGVLADDFSLYLHAPTRTDPSLAPEGCDGFYALSPVPNLAKAPIDWAEEGPRYAEKILAYLDRHSMPGLRDSVVTSRIFTPRDFRTELNAHQGTAFSLEPILRQSAYFRVHNRDPHLKGLYFVGAGTHPGAGIPGVVNSAKATAGLVIGDHRQERVTSALGECRQMIQVGSKSFSFASRLFDSETRNAAHFLYGWCRFCDDQVDETMNLRLQEERVGKLKEQTNAVWKGGNSSHPVFVALRHVVERYSIPSHYALELIEGMHMDVRRETYWTADELATYGYRVAGTVGLMMAHVMGVSDEAALPHAADLGTAMQLTNIARDVMDDAGRKRIYLPLAWLDDAGVPPAQIQNPKYRREVAQVVGRLLEEADVYYKSGNRGLRYLKLRSAVVVALASLVYQAIGREVRKRGPAAWDTRVIIPGWRKVLLLPRALGKVALTIPYRVLHPFRAVAVRTVWRHA